MTDFLEWRSPRRGNSNPELMTNPVWEWMIRTEQNGFTANDEMNGPSSFDVGPCWSAERFGQSSTELPDGRVIMVAGEHEDFYDPDFYIYNDVIVRQPNGELEIYGYDEKSFPPTDFHTATLVDESLWIIGSLGYPDFRKPGITQVLKLDTKNLEMTVMETSGEMPGWIHKHEARLSGNGSKIVVSEGEMDNGEDLVENIDEWELDLGTRIWKRLTTRNWPRWTFTRRSGELNNLFEIRFATEAGKSSELIEKLYTPEIPHSQIPKGDDDRFNVHRIEIDGVLVRYVEESDQVTLTVEGDLPPTTSSAIVDDLTKKLSVLEKEDYVVKEIAK